MNNSNFNLVPKKKALKYNNKKEDKLQLEELTIKKIKYKFINII